MIRKIGVLSISLLCLAAIVSCEKDFNNIGNSVVDNTKFETGELLLDVEITPIDLGSVRADNVELGSLDEYWLGVYNNPNYKKIESSIISQVSIPSDLSFTKKEKKYETTDVVLTPVLDEVILKIPLQATFDGKHSDGASKFTLDNLLGDESKNFTINVYQNNTYLSLLNQINTNKKNTYLSNKEYSKGDLLGSDVNFNFNDPAKDTVFYFNRTIKANVLRTFKDSVKVKNGTKSIPFKYIKLNKSFFQTNFIDKYDDLSFKDQESFNDKILKGLIIEIVDNGNGGAAVPLDLSKGLKPSIDLLLTTTVKNKNGIVIDSISKNHSYLFSGIRNSKYKMTSAINATPANRFAIQGTAGTMAEIKIINNSKLQELRTKNWLINDASLTFYIDQTINTNKDILPKKLFLYQNKVNKKGSFTPTNISDSYKDATTFGGSLSLSEDDAPEKYNFRITEYLSDLSDGAISDISRLILKVHNDPTDNAIKNNTLDLNVKSYNWNPRGVTLLNGNEAANGAKRAVLKVSYSKEK